MDQIPHLIDATNVRAAKRVMHRLALERSARCLRGYRCSVPPLRPDDAIGLTIGRMTDWWLGIHERGAPFSKKTLNVCAGMAVRYSIGADVSFAVACGVLPRVLCNQEAFWDHISRWFESWAQEQEAIFARGNAGSDLSRRERSLWQFALQATDICLPSDELLKRVQRGVRMWRKEWELRPSQDEEGPVELAATTLLAIKRRGLSALLSVEPSGAIGIRSLAIRDQLGPRGRGKRRALSLDEVVERPSEQDDPVLLAMKAEADRGVRDACEAIRTVAVARASRSKRGSARRVVLDNVEALLSGEVGLAELARANGLPKSTISAAWSSERKKFAQRSDLKFLLDAG